MTQVQRLAIRNPAIGLLVYQTNGVDGFYIFSRTGWKMLSSESGGASYTFTSPLILTGSTVSILQANATTNGFLSSTDWNSFNNKLSSNPTITAGTKTKVTYDSKGLVTAGADATTSDIVEGNNLYFTQDRVEKTKLSLLTTGVNSIINTNNTVTEAISNLQAQVLNLKEQLLELKQSCCNTIYTLGQEYGGGKIAYIDTTGKHGLIISTIEIAGGPYNWKKLSDNTINLVGAFFEDGSLNTRLLVNIYGSKDISTDSYAALAANFYNGGGYNDWYLPSYQEWEKINIARNNGVDLNIGPDVYYLTSSEDPWNQIGIQVLLFGTAIYNGTGGIIGTSKDIPYQIRAIRKF
jgi:hypothetical protein